MHPQIKISVLQSGASCRSTLRSCPDPRPRRWPPARQPGGGKLSPNTPSIRYNPDLQSVRLRVPGPAGVPGQLRGGGGAEQSPGLQRTAGRGLPGQDVHTGWTKKKCALKKRKSAMVGFFWKKTP